MRDKDLCECGDPKTKRANKCRSCWVPHNKTMNVPDPKTLAQEWENGMTMKNLEAKYHVDRKIVSQLIKSTGIEVRNRGTWKGGRHVDGSGYVQIYADKTNELEKAMMNRGGYIPEHRLVYARSLDRPLTKNETVHHINGVVDDNRLENLQLRNSSHGQGQALACGDCGSENVVCVELASQDRTMLRQVALDFQDVLIEPKRSTLSSRKEVDLTTTLRFPHSSFSLSCVPIISSNMTSVTTKEVAENMVQHNMLACLPKTRDWHSVDVGNYIPSFGLQEIDSLDHPIVCIDVPYAGLDVVFDLVTKTRSVYGSSISIIVGNVVSGPMARDLVLAGADAIKVGIGSGGACSTRIKTGVGRPQLSAIMECAEFVHSVEGLVISDGGCVVPGDIVKAFCAGADAVMLGSMLAGHDENGSDFYGMSSERANNEFAGGMRDYRASEGWEIELPARGPIERTLQDIEGGLRSACSYVGARRLKDLPKCATFVQVNRQANTSLWENRI